MRECVGSACVMWVCMGVRVLAFQLARSGDTPRTHISLRALLARVIPAAGATRKGYGPHYMAGKVNQLPGGPYPFPPSPTY